MEQMDFVVRSKHRLLLNGAPFRFGGPNIYWLGLDENVGYIDWPTEFRVINALDTAKEMGATVVRSHTLGVSVGHPKSVMPEPGVINEEALRRIDFVIREAGRRGLRLIIPFICNWNYYHGGRETFARWRGESDAAAFYHDPRIVDDFKAYISVIVNRVNAYTGIPNKENPAILAWELGNELNDAPPGWVKEIADFIKSIDPQHLVAHGKQFGVDADKLGIDSLDIMDVHYYPADGARLRNDAKTVAEAGKVFIAGEFGWPDGDMESFLQEAERTPGVSGTLFWSLFGHHDCGGYVQHFDGFTVHYPGVGGNPDIRRRVMRLRAHAYAMSGRSVPDESVPDAPVLLEAGEKIVFRGVVGAAYYTLERSVSGENGPWTVVFDKRPADYCTHWVDPLRNQIRDAWYRMRAFNAAGVGGRYSDTLHSRTMIQLGKGGDASGGKRRMVERDPIGSGGSARRDHAEFRSGGIPFT
jgi:mannan endo-1,4-beta-mannosidase